MSKIKTVDGDETKKFDSLLSLQTEGVERMRTSLLSCSIENPVSVSSTIKQVTVLRIYHQLARVVKYTELMDRLEEKLYDSIDYLIDNSDESDTTTLIQLLSVQERLQKSMIDSMKLLEPYMDILNYDISEMMPQPEEVNPMSNLLTADSREKIRNGAKAVLVELNAI